jgi:hypothetical protein
MLKRMIAQKFPILLCSRYEHQNLILIRGLCKKYLFQDCCSLDDIPAKEIIEKVARKLSSQKMSEGLMECVSLIIVQHDFIKTL